MFANVLYTFRVLRFWKTLKLKFDIIVQILPFHPSICCANRHGLSKVVFQPQPAFTVHQYTKHSANPTAASGLHVYITPQYRNHGANKQTDRRQARIMISLLKQIFILQMGRINLPQYARKEFLTVIYGCGGTTQMATAIVKKRIRVTKTLPTRVAFTLPLSIKSAFQRVERVSLCTRREHGHIGCLSLVTVTL